MRDDEAIQEPPSVASRAGRTKYLGKQPCPVCGSMVRYTSNCACVACSVKRSSVWNKARRRNLASAKP